MASTIQVRVEDELKNKSDALFKDLEYVMDLLNKPSITIEIGSSVAPCPHWQYEIEFQKNRYVVVRIANALK